MSQLMMARHASKRAWWWARPRASILGKQNQVCAPTFAYDAAQQPSTSYRQYQPDTGAAAACSRSVCVPDLTIRDILHERPLLFFEPSFYVDEGMSVGEVARLFAKANVAALGIVDYSSENISPRSVISHEDLIKKFAQHSPGNASVLRQRCQTDVSGAVVCVPESQSVLDVVAGHPDYFTNSPGFQKYFLVTRTPASYSPASAVMMRHEERPIAVMGSKTMLGSLLAAKINSFESIRTQMNK
jgi:hypothetical protein